MPRSSTFQRIDIELSRDIMTEYDNIKKVAENIDTIKAVVEVVNTDEFKNVAESLNAINVVGGIADKVVAVAEGIADIEVVAPYMNEINICANAADEIIAVANAIDSVVTVSNEVDDVITVAQAIDELVVVASNIANVIATGENIDKVNIVGMDLRGSGCSNVIDMGYITDPAESLPSGISNIETVADNIDSVNVVATNISGVIAVEANLDAVVNAEANALLAQTKAAEASESADEASASELAASQSALAAAQSETNAGLSELAAQGYANDAKDSELLAKDWASKGYGEEVEAGLYSAKHYAILAEAAVGGNIEIDMLVDVTIDTPIDGQVLTYDNTIGKWVNKPLFDDKVSWNGGESTFDVKLNDDVTLQVGQEQVFYVRNNSGVTIPNGSAVYQVGTIGVSGKITVARFIANGTIPAQRYIGVTTQDIPNGSDGFVTCIGKVNGIDTSGFNEGDYLYVSPTIVGGLTNVRPTAPNFKVPVGVVISSHHANGTICVRTSRAVSLNDIQDVEANGTVQDGDILRYNATTQRYELYKLNQLLENVDMGYIS